MCQATVYLVHGDGESEEIMRDTTRLSIVDGGVQVETFFENPVVVPARVASIDFLKNTVTLTPMSSAQKRGAA